MHRSTRFCCIATVLYVGATFLGLSGTAIAQTDSEGAFALTDHPSFQKAQGPHSRQVLRPLPEHIAEGRSATSRHVESPKKQGTVAGTVTSDATGEPLPGVNILVEGTQLGGATGADGTYTITGVEAGTYTIHASYVGYGDETEEGVSVQEGTTTTVDFVLQQEAAGLDEVVVVGYGQQQRRDLTGAVSSVSAEEMESLPVSGVDQALAGQVAGLEVNQGSGIPGGGARVRIRGTGSVGTGGAPLYVVDGFALPTYSGQVTNPLNSIPVGDIESVSVLKDASATAIYGSRGSNGVILIETKSGTAGDMQVQVNTYVGAQRVPTGRMPDLLNARQFAQWRQEYYLGQARYETGTEPTLEDVPEPYRNPGEWEGEGTDWYDEILRTALQYNADVSVSGGSENITSYVSGGYQRQEGVVEATGYERFSLRANVSSTLGDNLEIGARLAPTYSRRQLNARGGGGRGEAGFGYALVATPLASVYGEDGTYIRMVGSPGTFNYPNPVQALNEVTDEQTSLRALATVFAEYHFIEAISLRSSFNVNWEDTESETFQPSTIGELNTPPPLPPSGTYATENQLNWLSETTLSYEGAIGGDHFIDVLGGLTFQQQTNTSSSLIGDDFPGDHVQTLNAAGRINGNTLASEWSLISLLTRLNYSYGDKYLVTATVRRDGSSRFGEDNRWGLFPSLALGWRLSEEPFLDDASWLSNLKLRASYGRTGNFQIGNYTYLSQVNPENYVLGGGLASGQAVTSLSNSDLGWERTSAFNAGLDASIFNGRIALGVDLYRRITSDMLLDVEIPQSSGFSGVTLNRGEVRNQGIEVSLSTQNVVGEAFRWEMNVNVASNANEVLALGPGNDPLFGGSGLYTSNITRVGSPVGMFYGLTFDGLYESQEEIDNNPSYPGAAPGNLQPIDVDGDGNVSLSDDLVVVGNPHPDFTFGMTNTFRYENLDLRMVLDGSYGGERMRASREWFWNIDGVFNVTEDYFEDRWVSPSEPGDGRTPTAVGPGGATAFYRVPNEYWVEDNSHIRVKNITLGYTVPGNILGGGRTGRIYASMQNAFLLTRYPGNPSVTNYRDRLGPSRLAPGLDHSPYPVPRTVTIGVQLGF